MTDKLTRGQAFDIACRAAIKSWPRPGDPSWSWARSQAGRSCPWMVTLGNSSGPIVRVLVDDDGNTTIALV
jgi:hypothetical protein